jgi:hypothetical protein
MRAKEGKCGGEALHCAQFAMGGACSHEGPHEVKCKECALISILPNQLRELSEDILKLLVNNVCETAQVRAKELTSMPVALEYCSRALYIYHKHVVRGKWQTAHVEDVIKNAPRNTGVIIVDYKQKIESLNWFESTADHHAKSQVSLFGACLQYRTGVGLTQIETLYFDIVSLSNKQTQGQYQSCLQALMPMIKKAAPHLTDFYIVSDNGPNLSCEANMSFIWSRNKEQWGCETPCKVIQYLFYEAQCGKTVLDTHFSFVGVKLRRFARCVRRIESPYDVYEALTWDGTIKGSCAILIDPSVGEAEKELVDDLEASLAAPAGKKAKIAGIRSIHELIFGDDTIQPAMYCGLPTDMKPISPNNLAKRKLNILKPMFPQTFQGQTRDVIRVDVSKLEEDGNEADGVKVVKGFQLCRPLDKLVLESLRTISTERADVIEDVMETINLTAFPISMAEPAGKRIKNVVSGFKPVYCHGWAVIPMQRKRPPLPAQTKEIGKELVCL